MKENYANNLSCSLCARFGADGLQLVLSFVIISAFMARYRQRIEKIFRDGNKRF